LRYGPGVAVLQRGTRNGILSLIGDVPRLVVIFDYLYFKMNMIRWVPELKASVESVSAGDDRLCIFSLGCHVLEGGNTVWMPS
jgi:hypothetical protein